MFIILYGYIWFEVVYWNLRVKLIFVDCREFWLVFFFMVLEKYINCSFYILINDWSYRIRFKIILYNSFLSVNNKF